MATQITIPYDLSQHPYFEAWVDPESKITSYILKEHVAPLQKGFYFVNSSVSPDEKWLWFETAFPPAPYKNLAAVCLDPAQPEILRFPQAGFETESPLLTDNGRACFFTMGGTVWKQPLHGTLEEIARLPQEYIADRALYKISTHLTQSADGKYLLLDGAVGNHWFVAIAEIETGEIKILKDFGRHYNHAQFSPKDPKLFSIAQDWWRDKVTGQHFPFDLRIWLMDIDGTRFEPLRPTEWFGHNAQPCHEWWSADGLVCWVDYERGVYECDIDTRELRHVWQGPLCHAHSNQDRRYWCADESPYKWAKQPCQVRFFNREARQELNIASALPQPPMPRSTYHIDPHPHFSPKDSWVVYTTTVKNQVDVALAPVLPMI